LQARIVSVKYIACRGMPCHNSQLQQAQATTKLTITLPDEQLNIRQWVSTGQVASISAFVKRAVDTALAGATTWDLALQRPSKQPAVR
jgi:hypothetical protein